MLEIPGYPAICRICLVPISLGESVPLDAAVRNGADTYGATLEPILATDRVVQKSVGTFPTNICLTCRDKMDEFNAFRLETLANDLLLDAWIQFDCYSNVNPLSDLLHHENVHRAAIQRTLNRLEVLKDRSLDDVLNELLHPTIKDEIEIENAIFVDALQPVKDEPDEEPSNAEVLMNSSESEGDETEDKFSNEEGEKSGCTYKNCAPMVAGKTKAQHIREFHRAYCKVCGLVFQMNAHVMHHLAIHKADESRFCCELCERPFWRELDLNMHRKEFHGVELALRECPYCEERFNTRMQVIEHRDTHKDCKFCSKSFDSFKTLLQHMKRRHLNRLHSCQLCSSKFLGKQEYETHQQKHRDGVQENSIPFTVHGWTGAECLPCERMFFSHQYLKDHQQKDHTRGSAEKPARMTFNNKRSKEEMEKLDYKFKCPDCDARFRIRQSLNGHWKQQHSNVTFVCEHCGMRFNSRAKLKMHERYRHINEPHIQCEFCPKKCHTKQDLAKHRRTHTNEKPYACTYEGCDKAYKIQSALVKHIRYHTGERPYRCTYEGCEKAYTCSQLLKAHVRSHTLERPYACWYCEELFNTNNNRAKHCKRHHEGKPFGRELERITREQQQQKQQELSPKVDVDMK